MKALLPSFLEQLLNGYVRDSTAALELVEALDGRQLRVDLVGPGIGFVLIAGGGRLRVDSGAEEPADATVSGTPLELIEALRGDGMSSFGEDGLSLAGDALVAEQFASVLRLSRPDLEEQLSHLTGDVLAHKIGNAVRDVGAWSEQALAALLMNGGEYLQEESRTLPARVEVERFFTDVGNLRDSADRVSAKIDRYLAAAGS